MSVIFRSVAASTHGSLRRWYSRFDPHQPRSSSGIATRKRESDGWLLISFGFFLITSNDERGTSLTYISWVGTSVLSCVHDSLSVGWLGIGKGQSSPFDSRTFFGFAIVRMNCVEEENVESL